MISRTNERQSTPNSYKLIHSKNSPIHAKKLFTLQHHKSSEYFPAKTSKRDSGHINHDNNSSNQSNKELSESSRTSTYAKQQNKLLQKQVIKLKKEVQKYQKMHFQREDKNSSMRKLEIELVETYRVIQYYQAKIKQLEKICSRYEDSLNSTDKKSKNTRFSDIVEQLRSDNIQLRIQLEDKTKINNQITKQISDLSSNKVQLQLKIKELSKQQKGFTGTKNLTLEPNKPKFVDDYERQHLAVRNSNQPVVKKPNIPRVRRLIKASSGQSSGQQSHIQSQYRNNIYLKKKRNDESKSGREDSVSGRLKSKLFGNISSKLNNIDKELQVIKKENEKLLDQLDAKVNQIMNLKTINQQLESKVNILNQTMKNNKNTQNQPQKIVLSKNMLKQITKPDVQKKQSPSSNVALNNSNNDNKLSMFVSNINHIKNSIPQFNSNHQSSKENKNYDRIKNIKKTNYKFNQIKQKTLSKLTINLIKSQVSYDQLLDFIAQSWSGQDPNGLIQQLQTSPYNLSSQQTAQFMFQYNKIMRYISSKQSEQATKDLNEELYKNYIKQEIKKVLEDNIPYFKNITFRRDFTLNIQLANKFKNYQNQFEGLIKKYQNKMPYKDCEQIFIKEWGLSQEQFTSLVLKNYQESADMQFIQIEDIGRFYLTD